MPSVVLPLGTSRQRPEAAPTIVVPLEPQVHCWFVPPVQLQTMTGVPLVVPRPDASRHSAPFSVVHSRLPLYCHCCWSVPLQVVMTTVPVEEPIPTD